MFRLKHFLRKWKLQRIFQSNILDGATKIEQDYLKSFIREPSDSESFMSRSVRYVVFDTETTGFNSKQDSLLSIGAVGIHGNSLQVGDSFYGLIQRERTKGKDILIHGILPSESIQGREEKEVILEFLDFIQNSILIAHHIDFDLEFIHEALSKFSKLRLYNRNLDTAKLAERIEEPFQTHLNFEDRTQFQLDSLLRRHDLPTYSRHNALSDALSTGILFLKLQKRWNRMGYKQIGNILI